MPKEIVNCPVCGTPCTIEGHGDFHDADRAVTQYYKPVVTQPIMLNEKFDTFKEATKLKKHVIEDYDHLEDIHPTLHRHLKLAFAAGQSQPKGKSWEMWAVIKKGGELFIDPRDDANITSTLERANKIYAPSAGERLIRVRVTEMEE